MNADPWSAVELPALSETGRVQLTEQWPLLHPRNPLDPWGADDYTRIYPQALRTAATEPGDVLAVSIDQQRTAGDFEKELGLFLARSLQQSVNGTAKVPVLLSPAGQDPPDELAAYCADTRIPLLRGARPALGALAALARRALWKPWRSAGVGNPGRIALPSTEDEVLAALAGFGLDVPRTVRVCSAGAAAEALHTLGGPVVLKGLAAGLLHKTEAGLVRVGLTTATDVQAEATRMLRWGTGHGVRLELLVAEQIRGDLEVLVGFHRDPVFGPTHLLGLGGVWTEFLDVSDVYVGDLDDTAAARFLDHSRVGRMIADARGGPLHRDGVLAALRAVAQLSRCSPLIDAIDVNPLIVSRDRAVAVDAVLTTTTRTEVPT